LVDRKTYFNNVQILSLRKYLYIYGGFAFECQTACYDLWRYEIPFAPLNYYPYNDRSGWKNPGNHWTLVNDDVNYCPGPRQKQSMIAHQSQIVGTSSRDEHYIYIFGGIKVRGKEEVG